MLPQPCHRGSFLLNPNSSQILRIDNSLEIVDRSIFFLIAVRSLERNESDTHFAVVSRDYLGNDRSPWLLTAFEKKNSVLDNTMDTGETLSGERNDTATPQDTVSDVKGSNYL